MKRLLSLVLLFMLVITGCTAPAQPEAKPLKIAVLPVLDVLPLYFAEANGYFKANGVEVELVPVASAPERDQLMQAGQIDGMLTESVTSLIYNRDAARIKIVRFARTASPSAPIFRILAAKDSGIQSPADLKGVEIGISQGTIIDYMTDRALEKAGLAKEDIARVAVPKIDERLALLASGQLKAATLPDPVASLALQQGAVLVVDDTTVPDVSNSVYAFSIKSLEENPTAVKAFLKAVEQAVLEINKDKSAVKPLLVEKKLVPPPLLDSYVLPDYPTAAVPSQDQWADALAWAKERGLVTTDVSYASTVDGSFLP